MMMALPTIIGKVGRRAKTSQPKIAAQTIANIAAVRALRRGESQSRTMKMKQVIETTLTRNMRPRSKKFGFVHVQGTVAAPIRLPTNCHSTSGSQWTPRSSGVIVWLSADARLRRSRLRRVPPQSEGQRLDRLSKLRSKKL